MNIDNRHDKTHIGPSEAPHESSKSRNAAMSHLQKPSNCLFDETVPQKKPLRVAVVGCGAVTQAFHLPILAGHPDITVNALVDPNLKSVGHLASNYGIDTFKRNVSELNLQSIDAALIATPACFHAALSIEFLDRGIHVLVEKPMATSFDEAEAMVSAAERSGAILVVGLFRRMFRSSRMLKSLLNTELPGAPLSFHASEGSFFNWPSVTLGSMTKEMAGGGVLIDTGSHTIDQLLSFFDGPAEVLDYRDDSLGGVESDCHIRLRIRHRNTEIEGTVELSRTRQLSNEFQIECEHANLVLPISERDSVRIEPRGVTLDDPVTLAVRKYCVDLHWNHEQTDDVRFDFRAEIDDWINAIQCGRRPYLDGRTALTSFELIQNCYERRQRLSHAWVTRGLKTQKETSVNNKAGSSLRRQQNARVAPFVPGSNVKKQRVLVTGASGFIGSRVAELLALRDGWNVRALVHNPGSVSRLARLGIEMCSGSLLNQTDLARALDGCDSVAHLAYGTVFQRREAAATTVQGTKNLARAAGAAGVSRFVHVSTTAVNGTGVDGILTEEAELRPDDYDYAINKAQAERVIMRELRTGLPAIILRFPNVYGPFSGPYTIRAVDSLYAGIPVLVGSGQNPSNTLYVDNAAESIICALHEAGAESIGEVFNINDDRFSWRDYFSHYAAATGRELRSISEDELQDLRKKRKAGLFDTVSKLIGNAIGIVRSEEFKSLACKCLDTSPLGAIPRTALDRVPGMRTMARRLLKTDRPEIYFQDSSVDKGLPDLDVNLLNIYACRAAVTSQKAHSLLGYQPIVPREEAMDLTMEWCRYAGLIH